MEEKENYNEKYLQDSIKPVSIKKLEIIIEQMKNSVCKIHKNDGTKGTGFFCKIPLKEENEFLPMLITNYHIFSKEDIKNSKTLTITLNHDNNSKTINIIKREIFFYQNLDITLIEILKYEIRGINFLEIDSKINSNDKIVDDLFKKKSIYILNYQTKGKILSSFGMISEIRNESIFHKCSTDYGSSGSPILNLDNNQVIGIHCGSDKNSSFNLGISFKFLIKRFQNQFKLRKRKNMNEKRNTKIIQNSSDKNSIYNKKDKLNYTSNNKKQEKFHNNNYLRNNSNNKYSTISNISGSITQNLNIKRNYSIGNFFKTESNIKNNNYKEAGNKSRFTTPKKDKALITPKTPIISNKYNISDSNFSRQNKNFKEKNILLKENKIFPKDNRNIIYSRKRDLSTDLKSKEEILIQNKNTNTSRASLHKNTNLINNNMNNHSIIFSYYKNNSNSFLTNENQ